MVRVTIENVTKRFGQVLAVNNVSLKIAEGEFFTLLGPSGCGKTTLLRTVAGFYNQDQGHIYFNEQQIDNIPAHKRGTGMVFQNYAVFPHLNVEDNIAYGLKARRLQKQEIKKRTKSVMELVRLEGLERRRPSQLSGGQQQRVALARAMVIEPRVLLMDEPLSNLDAKLRIEMRKDIRYLQKKLGTTTMYVTHDQEEALTISDRLAIMRAGQVEQIGDPISVYSNPTNTYVSAFIGSTNILEGRVKSIDAGIATVQLADSNIQVPISKPLPVGENVSLAVRPENLSLTEYKLPPEINQLNGIIENVTFIGSGVEYQVKLLTLDRSILVRSYGVRTDSIKQQSSKIGLRLDNSAVAVYAKDEKVN